MELQLDVTVLFTPFPSLLTNSASIVTVHQVFPTKVTIFTQSTRS